MLNDYDIWALEEKLQICDFWQKLQDITGNDSWHQLLNKFLLFFCRD